MGVTGLNMDLKVMPRFYKGHKFILVVINDITNLMVNFHIHQSNSENIDDALIKHVHSMPEYMIMGQNDAFMSMLINYLFKKLGIKVKTFAPYDHQ